MRAILVLSGVAIAIAIATASISRGEGETESGGDADDTTEPITETAVMPFKGSEQPMKDPFTPFDIGDPDAAWSYEHLSADEKRVADKGLDEDQTAVQDAYATAAGELAARAKSEAAANQLGVDGLDRIGVVGGEEAGAP